MQRRLYYLTIDDANRCRFEGLAVAERLDGEAVEPRDLAWLEREQAEVVLDWDYLPSDDRSRLLNGSAVQVVGIHGYNLSESVASFLPRRGIVVSRHLDQMFVAAVAQRNRAA